MDWMAFTEIGVGALGALWAALGFFYKQGVRKSESEISKNTDLIEALRSDLARHQLYCAQTYVTSPELNQSVSDIKQTLERVTNSMETLGREMREVFLHIQGKIDSKADK